MSFDDSENIDISVGGSSAGDSSCCFDTSGIEKSLNDGLTAIVDALTEIDNTLQDEITQSCTIVDDCKADILAMIEETYNTGASDCDSCRADLAAGLGGTLEYAVRCAGACIDDIQQTIPCSLTNEGEACTTCGQSPCCCTDGICTPCGEQPQPTNKYRGWCDYQGGEVIVTLFDDPPPGPNFTSVAYGDTEQVVFDEALNTCKSYIPNLPPDIGPPNAPDVGALGRFCSIDVFIDGYAGSIIAQQQAGLNIAAGTATTLDGIRKFGLEGINLGNVGDVLLGLMRQFTATPPVMADTFLPKIVGALGCNDPGFVHSINAIASFGMMEKIMGGNFDEFLTPYKYTANSLCRNKQGTPDQALSSYLANGIDYEHLDAHYAIAGLCPETKDNDIAAAKSKLTPAELISARRRDLIDDPGFQNGFRQLGFLEPWVADVSYQLTEKLPDLATATQILRNGGLNDTQAERLGLDFLSEQLSQGTLYAWLNGNGVTNEVAKAYWRSSWSTPSVGQLFEFYHRLRNDESFGSTEQQTEDITNAFTSLGIPPYWQTRLMAVALQPLLKRDIRVAYTSGALTDKDLPKALEQTGHTEEAIDTIVRELKPARRTALQSHVSMHAWIAQHIDSDKLTADLSADGYDDQSITQAMYDAEPHFMRSTWADAFSKGLIVKDTLVALLENHGVSTEGALRIADNLSYKIVDHQAVKNYITGTVSRSAAGGQMIYEGMAGATTEMLLSDADDAVKNGLSSECVRGVKERYLKGEITNDEAYHNLQNSGLDSSRVSAVLSGFDCSKRAEGTAVAVEKLCHWLYMGTIDPATFLVRVMRLGYTEDNAALLLQDCLQANTLRQIKEAKALAAESLRDFNRQLADRNKAAAVIERQRKQAKAARAKAAKLRSDRDRQKIIASERLYKLTTEGLPAAVDAVTAAISRGQSVFGLTLDESLMVVLEASDKFPKGSVSNFVPFADVLSNTAATSGNEPTLEEVSTEPSENGSTQPSG